jgi:hypothetical protein
VVTAKVWRTSCGLGRRALDPGGGSSPVACTKVLKVAWSVLSLSRWPMLETKKLGELAVPKAASRSLA